MFGGELEGDGVFPGRVGVGHRAVIGFGINSLS